MRLDKPEKTRHNTIVRGGIMDDFDVMIAATWAIAKDPDTDEEIRQIALDVLQQTMEEELPKESTSAA